MKQWGQAHIQATAVTRYKCDTVQIWALVLLHMWKAMPSESAPAEYNQVLGRVGQGVGARVSGCEREGGSE